MRRASLRSHGPAAIALATAALAIGCAAGESRPPGAASTSGAGGDGGGPAFGGERPVSVHAPPSSVGGEPMPLVIVLHGYAVSGLIEDGYFHLTQLADERGFLTAHPDGTVDSHS